MYEQMNDMLYLVAKERMADMAREVQAAQNPTESPGRLFNLWCVIDDYLGDLLIRLGERLKHHRPYPPHPHHV
jgi:hypothetical protein